MIPWISRVALSAFAETLTRWAPKQHIDASACAIDEALRCGDGARADAEDVVGRELGREAFRLRGSAHDREEVQLPSYEQICEDKKVYAEFSRLYHLEHNPDNARILIRCLLICYGLSLIVRAVTKGPVAGT